MTHTPLPGREKAQYQLGVVGRTRRRKPFAPLLRHFDLARHHQIWGDRISREGDDLLAVWIHCLQVTIQVGRFPANHARSTHVGFTRAGRRAEISLPRRKSGLEALGSVASVLRRLFAHLLGLRIGPSVGRRLRARNRKSASREWIGAFASRSGVVSARGHNPPYGESVERHKQQPSGMSARVTPNEPVDAVGSLSG